MRRDCQNIASQDPILAPTATPGTRYQPDQVNVEHNGKAMTAPKYEPRLQLMCSTIGTPLRHGCHPCEDECRRRKGGNVRTYKLLDRMNTRRWSVDSRVTRPGFLSSADVISLCIPFPRPPARWCSSSCHMMPPSLAFCSRQKLTRVLEPHKIKG